LGPHLGGRRHPCDERGVGIGRERRVGGRRAGADVALHRRRSGERRVRDVPDAERAVGDGRRRRLGRGRGRRGRALPFGERGLGGGSVGWGGFTSRTTNELRGVWARTSTDGWAVGDAGTALRWNGTDWVPQPAIGAGTLRAVWGSAVDDVYAVGDGGAIYRFD